MKRSTYISPLPLPVNFRPRAGAAPLKLVAASTSIANSLAYFRPRAGAAPLKRWTNKSGRPLAGAISAPARGRPR